MGRECGRRVDVVGGKGQHAFFGGLLEARDVGRCYFYVRIEVSRIWTIVIPSQLNQSKQIPLYPLPSLLPAVPVCSAVCAQKSWGKVLTLSTQGRT